MRVRAGHHCAQPLMRSLGVHATTRASFAVHNSGEDVRRLIDGLGVVRRQAPTGLSPGSRLRAVPPVNLYSDTQTRPTDGMRAAIAGGGGR